MAYETFAELLEAACEHGSLARAALAQEVVESGESAGAVRARLTGHLTVMRDAVEFGLNGTARSRSGLVGGDAARIDAAQGGPLDGVASRAIAAAVAVAEVNASMGRVVAAPTGGASGVLPGVLLTLADERALGDDAIVDALLAAGAIGAVIASRTNLSGAAAGCQAEIGAGAAMAAGAATELLGGTPEQSGHAASLALQGLLGLVCDPVGGLVEVPCVMRNATGTAVALSAIQMALAGVRFPIPFDQVADALASVGRALPVSLRETATGGLAITPAARALVSGGADPATDISGR
ncbi:MAG: L-serine ammonia-lyase, iron-sulfur-dependent, subunit alpha [Coriobacteriia bacterium]|nr:L-serine ammonia-lyase, iron-sulfur-dependent, subunit alpha [Coriobacteriia bacterium]